MSETDGSRPRLIAAAEARLDAIIETTLRLVECESPSSDHAALARSAAVVAELGSELLGTDGEAIVVDGVTHVRFRIGSGPRRVLLVGHHDTVWPVGSLASHPWHVGDGRMRGPGCVDMKAGIAQGFHALALLRESGADLDGVTFLVTGDEEIGSPTSRALIEAEAVAGDAALVLEGSASIGAIKTGRKGTAQYRLEVVGRAAHAGVEPKRGANATVELARQILAAAALNDYDGSTVTPTLVNGGRSRNTVPDEAWVHIDARAWTVDEQHRIDRELHALSPVDPRCRLVLTGGPDRPPMEPGQAAGLFALASRVAEREGLPPLSEVAVGGGSDGNYTAAAGVPTLDGLGAVGGGAHADSEHVRIDAIAPRTALLAGLVRALLTPPLVE